MEKITTESTSLATASANDIALREKQTVRLIFRPTLVNNPHNKDAVVSGVFLYQKKGLKEQWIDFETIALSKVKKGEGYKLDLSTGEMLNLFQELEALYELHREVGVPRGRQEFVRLDAQLKQFVNLPNNQIAEMLNANKDLGGEFVTKLISWALSETDPTELVKRLSELSPDSLRVLNTSASVQRLNEAVSSWYEHRHSKDESLWQTLLTENMYVLEQVFSWPVTIVNEKAYVGGKAVDNKGGGLVDFLVKNQLTNNVALIEIKTPGTELLSKNEYRNGVYNLSEELTGSVMQVLNYKATLLNQYNALGAREMFEAFDPKCMVIIGNSGRELGDSKSKRKTFALYRNQLAGADIVTFDELVQKTRNLIKVLETTE